MKRLVKNVPTLWPALTLILMFGRETVGQDRFIQEYVVESCRFAGEPMSEVRRENLTPFLAVMHESFVRFL